MHRRIFIARNKKKKKRIYSAVDRRAQKTSKTARYARARGLCTPNYALLCSVRGWNAKTDTGRMPSVLNMQTGKYLPEDSV